MNLRPLRSRSLARLPLLLIWIQLCLWRASWGQDATPPVDESSYSAPAPTDPALGAPSYFPETTAPTTYGEPSYGPLQPDPYREPGSPEYGVPESSIFPITGTDGDSIDPLRAHGLYLDMNQGVKAGGVEGSLSLGGLGGGASPVPFIYRRLAPEDAMLKAGPFYLKINRFDADFIYTDNYHLSERNRQSEELAVLALNMTLIAQLTDDLQFAVNGTVIYLPIQNIVGVESSSLAGNLGFLLGALPLLSGQVSYDTMIAGWDVRFADNFSSTTGQYSDNTNNAFNIYNGGTLQQTGRNTYTFHSGHVNTRSNSYDNSRESQDYFAVYVNTISALTTGYIPGDIQVTARALRSDLWYNQSGRGLPSSREDFYLLAQTARPNMRFTTFASYDVSHSSDVPGVFQSFRVGLFGPITDQLFLFADGGYYLSNTGRHGELWTLDLYHDAGPYTQESVHVGQELSDFDDEVTTSESYLLRQILGPTLTSFAFAEHSEFQEFANGDFPNRSQEDAGAGLIWALGPRTQLTLIGIYTHQKYTDGYGASSWSGRADLERDLTDNWFLRAFYQYQNYEVNQPNSGFTQDIFFLGITKYFQ